MVLSGTGTGEECRLKHCEGDFCGLWRGLLGGLAMLRIFSEHLPARSLGGFAGR